MKSFNEDWRSKKSAAFELKENSTSKETTLIDFWNQKRSVYTNANLSIYSAQECNARCPFCVEELRPSSRGVELHEQKRIEENDEVYFSKMKQVLLALKSLDPSTSLTGGEISKDRRLPRILRTLQDFGSRKRSLTTNGSGLLDLQEGRRVIDWIADTKVRHLNISLAHFDLQKSQSLMRYKLGPSIEDLKEIVKVAKAGGVRVRLSCILLSDEIDTIANIKKYLNFASEVGVDNVIFRQLMKTDPSSHLLNFVVRYSDQKRVLLEPILNGLHSDSEFTLSRQIMGYYYYVEVWRYRNIDVVFEEADLAQLELSKKENSNIIHELVFHPNAMLSSTWQSWDGILGPWPENEIAIEKASKTTNLGAFL